MSDLASRLASDAETELCNNLAEPIFDYLRSLPGEAGMAVLCTLNALVVLNAETSVSKVEAWDHVAAAVRKTIEGNEKARLS